MGDSLKIDNKLIKKYMNETGNLPPQAGGDPKAFQAWLDKQNKSLKIKKK